MTRALAVVLVMLAGQPRALAAPTPQPAPSPPPSPPSPPPPPDDLQDGYAPPTGATCDGCARAMANFEQLGVHGALLHRAVGRFGGLGQLGIIESRITRQQQQQLEQMVSDDDRNALRIYMQNFGDAGLGDLARLACQVDDSPCVASVHAALRCAASSACVAEPYGLAEPDSRPPPDRGCDPYVKRIKSRKTGFGPEIATGWQDSASPNEHRAWGFGFEIRRRLAHRFGVLARFDRSTGRDEGIDSDGDGRDDVATGKVARVSALGGASVILTDGVYNGVPRYLELDLVAGYSAMTSPDNENGVVAGADLSFQVAVLRFGLRALQGFGDARDARAVLAHFGFVIGGSPSYAFGSGCGAREPEYSSGFAIAMDIPLSGYALGTHIGYSPPFGGFGVESAYFIHPHFQALTRGDLLVFLNGDADHVLHHALLAGGRIDLSPVEGSRNDRTGPFITLLAGYSWGAVTRPSKAGSGAVIDASLGYLYQEDDGAMWARLHGRFGMMADNADLRALFLTVGMEIRLDKTRWKWKPD